LLQRRQQWIVSRALRGRPFALPSAIRRERSGRHHGHFRPALDVAERLAAAQLEPSRLALIARPHLHRDAAFRTQLLFFRWLFRRRQDICRRRVASRHPELPHQPRHIRVERVVLHELRISRERLFMDVDCAPATGCRRGGS
jgi:hypothetical protein